MCGLRRAVSAFPFQAPEAVLARVFEDPNEAPLTKYVADYVRSLLHTPAGSGRSAGAVPVPIPSGIVLGLLGIPIGPGPVPGPGPGSALPSVRGGSAPSAGTRSSVGGGGLPSKPEAALAAVPVAMEALPAAVAVTEAAAGATLGVDQPPIAEAGAADGGGASDGDGNGDRAEEPGARKRARIHKE